MGWLKGSLVAAGVVSASVMALAMAPQEQPEKKEQDSTRSRRERVIVMPQIEVFREGGARLGVGLRDLDEATVRERKLAGPDGVLVESVETGSAAEKGGIKTGDVITTFDGERVRSVRQLQRLVGDTPPDRQVKVVVIRDGKKVELAVSPTRESGRMRLPGGEEFRFEGLDRNLDRLRDLPRAFRYDWDEDQAPGDVRPLPRTPGMPRTPPAPLPDGRFFGPRWPLNQWSSGAGRLGVVVQELTPQLGEYFGAKEGVLVSAVSEGSPAASAGVKAGDVITTVNGKAVKNAQSLVQAVREQPDGQDVTLGILRDKKAQTLKVKLLATHPGEPI